MDTNETFFKGMQLTDDEGCLCVLNAKGDVKITWNKKKPKEVEAARKMFEDLVVGKKYAAFKVGKLGKKDKKVTEFDPNMGKVIIIPPVAGG